MDVNLIRAERDYDAPTAAADSPISCACEDVGRSLSRLEEGFERLVLRLQPILGAGSPVKDAQFETKESPRHYQGDSSLLMNLVETRFHIDGLNERMVNIMDRLEI